MLDQTFGKNVRGNIQVNHWHSASPLFTQFILEEYPCLWTRPAEVIARLPSNAPTRSPDMASARCDENQLEREDSANGKNQARGRHDAFIGATHGGAQPADAVA